MPDASNTFSAWLDHAQISESRLTPDQRGVLLAVFHFRQQQGNDSYSTRLLTHFLLHCDTGLKVAALARLLGLGRPTASRQQGMSSKQAVQQAHHRLDGRPYGKLLPRYAGAILEFRLTTASIWRRRHALSPRSQATVLAKTLRLRVSASRHSVAALDQHPNRQLRGCESW